MYFAKSFLIISIFILLFLLPAKLVPASLELFGNFKTIGVLVTFNSGDDPEADAIASLHYKLNSATIYSEGFSLTRTKTTQFVGSLFWLTAGTSYDIQVTISDATTPSLDGTVLTSTLSTRPEIVFANATKSYFVSPFGNGSEYTESNPGSLSNALNLVQAGEEIVFLAGTYYQGGFNISNSGTETAPITIRAKTDETVIMDGSDSSTFTWISEGNDIFSTILNVTNTKLVLSNNKRLYCYNSYSDLNNLVWGTAGFYEESGKLYVKLDGGINPNTTSMDISKENFCFSLYEQNYYSFRNIHFKNYGQGSWAKAIYLHSSSNNVIDNCTFGINNLGVGLKRNTNQNTIQNCEFYDDTDDWDWDGMKASYVESTLLSFYDPVYGRGNVIRNNIFHNCMDGLTPSTFYVNPKTTETNIYNNTIYNAGDDAISTDGWTSNLRVWNNTMHDVLVGISFAPTKGGPVYAIRNLIYNVGIGNNNYTGMTFKFNYDDESGIRYLFHNTCDAVIDGDGLEIRHPGTWDNIYARNNIWSGTRYTFRNVNTSNPIDFDYDNLYTSDNSKFAYWGGSGALNSLSEFQTSTGQELNGINVNPEFISPSSDTGDSGVDYNLQNSSDCINVGIFIPGINDDYYGTAPDLGAFKNDQIVPVELEIFTAKLTGKVVELNWQTATEVNNYSFEIERQYQELSIKNQDWVKIGFIKGHGNSNSPKKYSFIDNTITQTGKYSYRLKQTDIDGSFEYSNIIEVTISIPLKFELLQNYPNPFNPATNISFTLPNYSNIRLTILNALGQEIAELINENKKAGFHNYTFDASSLSSGVYYYRITTNNHTETKQMILIK